MKKESTLLFLSKNVPLHMRDAFRAKRRGSMQDAAMALQDKLIAGFEENLQKPVTQFNLLPVSSYPKYYADAFVKGGYYSHTEGARDYNVGFCNIAYIKRLFLAGSYLRQFRKFFKKQEFDTVVCYSANIIGMAALKAAKKRKPDIKTCLIIPDMPEFNDLSNNKSLLHRLYNCNTAKRTRSYIPYIDSFVYLTEQSAAYFCDEKPYVVVEGIAEPPEHVAREQADESVKTVVYTGTTHEAFGVMNLVRSFGEIPDPQYRLVICGCGDSDEKIRQAAQADARISFPGVVSREEALRLQQTATVLVNPRQNVGEFTKYSFPSKTMEYLTSGVPVVAYKLDGIPEEYGQYLTYVQGDSDRALAESIRSVCEMSSQTRREMGQAARTFVLEQKNAKAQTQKILTLFKE